MDLLQFIKLVSIARWLKFLSLGFVLFFLALAGYVVIEGLHLGKGDVLQAGTTLMGVLLPIFLVIFFLSFYESGTAPLGRATEKVLLELVPTILGKIREEAVESGSPTQVQARLYKSCVCRYTLKLPGKYILHLSLEINVRKATVAIHFLADRVGKELSAALDKITSTLPHTLAGAAKEGYHLNENLHSHVSEGKTYHTIVLYRDLPNDFLWNSAEKLYFAQDMLFFLNALVVEGERLLEKEGATS